MRGEARHLANMKGRYMMAGADCPKCGKHFRKAASLAKWHGWCLKPDDSAVRNNIVATPRTGFSDGYGDPFAEKPRPKGNGNRAINAHLADAEEAGRAAAAERVPEPMNVVQHADVLDDSSPIVKRYAPVMAGVCGFAWVSLKGGTRLANTMKKRYKGDRLGVDRVRDVIFGKDWPSGMKLSIMGFGQSMERKEAYAHAYAQSLREAGYEGVYAGSRMD